MISHDREFIWVAIPRTGSTSGGRLLLGDRIGQEKANRLMRVSAGNANVPKKFYMTMLEARALLTPGQFNSYFKFTIVRNPWTRLLSMYTWAVVTRNKGKMPFKDWVKGYEEGKGKVYHPEKKFREQQIHWIADSDKRILVDFVGKFENLAGSWREICGRLAIPFDLPRLKVSNGHQHYTSYYDKETRDIVHELFKDDIEMLGYEFGKD